MGSGRTPGPLDSGGGDVGEGAAAGARLRTSRASVLPTGSSCSVAVGDGRGGGHPPSQPLCAPAPSALSPAAVLFLSFWWEPTAA